METDLTPKLKEYAHQILFKEVQTGHDRSKLVAEKAKEANLNNNQTHMLWAITNKEKLIVDNHKDLSEPVTPEKVAAHIDSGYLSKAASMESESVPTQVPVLTPLSKTKVAYLFPEFNPKNMELPVKEKTASVEEEKPLVLSYDTKVKIASIKLGKELHEARKVFMEQQTKIASVYEKLTQNIYFLKGYGFTTDELKSKMHLKTASECNIMESFFRESKKIPTSYKLYKEAMEFTPYFNKGASLIREFEGLAPAFAEAEKTFFELNDKRNRQMVTVNA